MRYITSLEDLEKLPQDHYYKELNLRVDEAFKRINSAVINAHGFKQKATSSHLNIPFPFQDDVCKAIDTELTKLGYTFTKHYPQPEEREDWDVEYHITGWKV